MEGPYRQNKGTVVTEDRIELHTYGAKSKMILRWFWGRYTREFP